MVRRLQAPRKMPRSKSPSQTDLRSFRLLGPASPKSCPHLAS
ncbi:hypothetical protein BRADI_3g03522v3 [Brachypodium distachyon]|uniref:Uncharacterized protein n=1 Tax=Brachypodium distachyon TaxID=15368 RepID=A0A2K2CUZ5_BRADI|nr:hypothetical protein BRADI_3g03522v3 [Brachypodium distachyon]